MRKRILRTVLLLSMVVALFPMCGITASAAVSNTGSVSVNDTRANTTEIVFGGKNWLVIGYNGTGVASESGSMTLLAKDNIVNKVMFHNDYNDYAGSDLKVQIDKLAGLTSDGNGGLFTQSEQDVIQRITLTGGGISIAGGDVENAILWPLDHYEATIVNTDILRTNFDGGSNKEWWLRSVYSNQVYFELWNGILQTGHPINQFGVRPAFKLNLSSILFTSGAVGGKSSTAGASLVAIALPTDPQKLTLRDDTLDSGVITVNGANINVGTTVNVNVTGATASKSLSAIITDSTGNTVKYYGKIADTDPSGAVVDANLTLPITLDTNNVLKFLVEEINGDNLTDYASEPKEATITLTPSDTTAPILAEGDVNRTSDTSCTVKFTSDEAGSYYYAVVEDGAGEPVITTSGLGTACTTGETTITDPDGLTVGAKDIYIIVKDAADNVSNALEIDINAFAVIPSITTHPSNQEVNAGSNTSFTVEATGTGLTYQWQKDTGSGFSTISNGDVYSGATTATLNITGATAGMNGYRYRVVVTGTVAPSATSNAATLTVNTAATYHSITTVVSPTNGGSVSGAGQVPEGGSKTLKAKSNSGYQFLKWTKDGNTVGTSSTLLLTNIVEDAEYTAFFKKSSSDSKEEEKTEEKAETTHKDDTAPQIPSALPYRTTQGTFVGEKSAFNIKALESSTTSTQNQSTLATYFTTQYFKGKTGTTMACYDMHAPWGAKREWKDGTCKFTWNIDDVRAGDTVFVIWYNERNPLGAQLIEATVAADNSITFTIPYLGDVSTISVVKVN
ncbi:MAG: hypothetical protein PHY47_09735 [Lachnospiraceae bacterium]|nr:hypothetical protein [Lachnospiraceae bacterium]